MHTHTRRSMCALVFKHGKRALVLVLITRALITENCFWTSTILVGVEYIVLKVKVYFSKNCSYIYFVP